MNVRLLTVAVTTITMSVLAVKEQTFIVSNEISTTCKFILRKGEEQKGVWHDVSKNNATEIRKMNREMAKADNVLVECPDANFKDSTDVKESTGYFKRIRIAGNCSKQRIPVGAQGQFRVQRTCSDIHLIAESSVPVIATQPKINVSNEIASKCIFVFRKRGDNIGKLHTVTSGATSNVDIKYGADNVLVECPDAHFKSSIAVKAGNIFKQIIRITRNCKTESSENRSKTVCDTYKLVAE